ARTPAGPTDGSSAGAFADVDGDGDLDLVRTSAGSGTTELWANDGTGRFTDATGGSGLDDLGPVAPGRLAHAHGLTFADVDRDGRLDLLVTHWDEGVVAGLADPAANSITPDTSGSLVCARAAWLRDRGWPRPPGTPPNRSRLYRNEGGGRFRDVTAQAGLPLEQVMGFTGTFADIDRDGWPDLLLTGDFCTSRLFRNEGGTRFVDVTRSAGVGTDENGMGSVVSDVDRDGDPDWFITGIGPVGDTSDPGDLLGGYGSSGNRLYLNDGSGAFTDGTDTAGVRNGGWGWGAAVADLANTGRPAVVMTNGYSTAPVGEPSGGTAAKDPLRLWVPDAAGPRFTEASAAAGLDDTGMGHGLVTVDVDGDGDLDVVVANFGTAPRLYRNDTLRRHWIRVRLDDPSTPGNREGIGAVVRVLTEDGPVATREVATGGSYESQGPPEVHVGLGDRGRVSRVEVVWPGSGTPQVVEAPPVDRVLTVSRAPGT
ncbi:MAG: CRTAC1 family protein, partial [Microthrixaceae bacterium]